MKTWMDFYEVVQPWSVGGYELLKEPDTMNSIRLSYQFHGRDWGWINDSWYEELADNSIYREARGDILMAGLGIAYEQYVLCHEEGVDSVTSVECEADVIEIVETYFKDEYVDPIAVAKHTIVHDKILHYLETTDRKFDVIYFDIFMDDMAFPDEKEILTDAADRCLNPHGRILFWRLYRPLDL